MVVIKLKYERLLAMLPATGLFIKLEPFCCKSTAADLINIIFFCFWSVVKVSSNSIIFAPLSILSVLMSFKVSLNLGMYSMLVTWLAILAPTSIKPPTISTL